ncbi:alpha/beta hydrolase [Conexibacter sp. SYSU D00693]|uniref:alpha/beta hydrolase n=1 Tax=Conexibacter sp. SYSU D00693 TaxID=2812560 RepID=UPI00196A579D|nr:alpha/beta hydrolase [Conexibacter sp. SYSU D00693]
MAQRSDVSFPSGQDRCAAWLWRPEGDGPHPVVVMAHGFSATRELRLDAYAERFAAAGLGVLLFDYRHFGASEGEPRQLLDIGRQHADFRAAIRYARGLDWADPSRIALFGSSFSGGHVVAVAAKDERIAAVVAQCPFQDGLATLPKLGVKNVVGLTVAGLRDQVGALLGRPPHTVPAVGPPGSLAVMATPDAEPGFRALVPPEGTRWENRVAARIALRVALYRPGRAARRLRCPALWCVCDHDSLAPAGATVRHAQRAPRGEVRRYPLGHFDVYVGDAFEQVVADQLEFLVRHLRPTAQDARFARAADAASTPARGAV